MYPLDNVQELRPLNLIKERGIVGVASGLVRCDSRYRRLIDTLLGRTVVVENLAIAERVIRRGMARSSRHARWRARPSRGIRRAAGSSATVQAAFVPPIERSKTCPSSCLASSLRSRNAKRHFREAARQQEQSERRIEELAQTIDGLREQRAASMLRSAHQMPSCRSSVRACDRSPTPAASVMTRLPR